MRILYDARKIASDSTGVGYVTEKLLQELDKYKNLEIIALTKKGVKDFSFIKHKFTHVTVHETPDYTNYFGIKRVLFEQTYLPRLINLYKPEILHLTNGFSVPFFLNKKQKKLKIILTIHDLIPLTPFCEFMSGIDRFIFKKFLDYSIRQADTIISVSETTKKDIYHFFPKAKNVTTIYNGIESVFFPPNITEMKWKEIKNKYQLNDNFICYLGGFAPRKNVISLVKAYSQINDKYPDYQLVICGKFSDNPEIKKTINEIQEFAINKNIKNKIKILGYLTLPEKNALLTKAKFFTYLSLYEGFGLPILEALSVGTPALTSKHSAMEEIAKKYAVYANPRSIEDIAKKMDELIVFYPDYKKRAEEAKTKLIPQFNWKKTGGLYIKEYLSLKNNV